MVVMTVLGCVTVLEKKMYVVNAEVRFFIRTAIVVIYAMALHVALPILVFM